MEPSEQRRKAGAPSSRLARLRAPGVKPFRAGQYALLGVVLLVTCLPLLWIVLTAFKPDSEIVAFPPTIIPTQVTLKNFENLFRISSFGSYLTNSLMVATSTTILTVTLGMFAAYAFTRFRFRFLRGVGELSLFAYMIPPILVLVPIAQILTGLRLSNNLLALIILYTATLLPFALWVLRSYFYGITVELEQAAMVDGCSRFGAFIRVVVPQAVPGLIATAVFTFNAAWSEYLFASTLMTSPKTLTLSPGLALLLDQTGVYSWGVLMAGCVIVVAPVVVLFVIAQRQLVGGVGEGALKG